MRSFAVRLLVVVAVLSLTCNVFLYLRYSSTRPLVTVGKEVITKKQYQDRLEQQAGQDVLSKMVFDKLVTQAAARDGVTPKPTDVDDQIKNIQRRSPQLLVSYNDDPAKMAEFRHDLQLALALENLRIKDVALTPADVAAYYDKNRDKFVLPQQVQASNVVTRNPVDASTAEALLRQKTPLDVLARQPRLMVVGMNGYNPDLGTLPVTTKQQIDGFIKKAQVGDIRTFSTKLADGTYYMTFRVTSNSPGALPPLMQIRSQVERQARLAHAPTPQMEIARLYHTATPTFSSDRYAAYFNALPKLPAGQEAGKKTASDR